jgi:ATP-dependent Clp protease ATP-binding subunit ClpC
MGLDSPVLNDALIARNHLIEIEGKAERRRVAYHQAIRRLHSSGASMREIAEALDLSHQRVHQIVNGGEEMTTSTRKKTLLRRLVGRNRKGCEASREFAGGPGQLLDRFFVDARDAMLLAEEEARALHHDYLGTEHLLLGLMRAERGLAARLLVAVGADLQGTRDAIERLLGRAESGGSRSPLPTTPRLKKVVELSRLEAKESRSTHVRSEHLLLALAREGEGVGARLLAELGVVYEALRRRLHRAALACSFCARSGLDVDHLIAGPGVFICEHCTGDAARLGLESERQEAGEVAGGLRLVPDETSSASCSFCGKRRADVDRLVAPEAVLQPGGEPRFPVVLSICDQCLAICQEIQQEEQRG